MASIISAGTTSGTSLNLSGDTSGVLQLATNGSTTAVTISTGQLVGIGTTSPDGLITLPATASNTPKIRLQSATSDVDVTISSYADSSGTYAAFGSNFYLNSSGDEAVFDSAKRSSFIRVDGRNTGAITFGTATTGVTAERMRIDASGNVGIGETSPAGSANYTQLVIRGTNGAELSLKAGATQYGYIYGDSGGLRIINPQSGASSGTMQFFTSNTERMRILSTGNILSLAGGSTTATGTGIAFPATQSASSDANTLDDYEEGTFTPVMQFGGAAAFSSGTANGKYTKVGNIVTFEIQFGGYTKTANTGSSQITGLPFSFSDLQKVYISQGDGLTYTSGAFLFCYNPGSGTTLDPYQQAAGTASQLTNSSFGNGGTFRVCGSYFTTT